MICQGCGVHIQTDRPNELGYTPKSSLKREDILCQRCFRMKHYNETADIPVNGDDFVKMIEQIKKTSSLIVHIIDLFDVNGSLITNLPRLVGQQPIILVGNKKDLLPKSTNENKVIQWLRSVVKAIHMPVEDVFLISSVKGHGIEVLMEKMDAYRKGRDVYIVGTTNVGKSTFINRMIKGSSGLDHVITTSYYPGTTLGFIHIPLDDRSFLIDTPGILNKKQMVHYISKEDLKRITPKKEIKPRTYQLSGGQTLFFGGLARLDIIKSEKKSFVCYFSNDVPIHRTKTANATTLYHQQVGKLLTPPDEKTLKKLPAFTMNTYKIGDERVDIVFPGLGWVTIIGGDVTVEAHSPKEVSTSLRRALT